MEPEWNRSGTGVEPERNRSGTGAETGVEPEWNRSGTGAEPEWNRSGTGVEPKQNRSGTGAETGVESAHNQNTLEHEIGGRVIYKQYPSRAFHVASRIGIKTFSPGQYSSRAFHVASRIGIKTLSPDNTHPGRFMWHPGSESRHYPRTILIPGVSCGIPDRNQDIIPGQYSPGRLFFAKLNQQINVNIMNN